MKTITVTSGFVAQVKPYRVRMTCGHVEIRKMREATAGIPWTETAEVLAPYAQCAACRGEEL
jgi:hypothetical protein